MEDNKYITVFNKTELDRTPSNTKISNSYWQYFLILESDFRNTLRYIHLEEENYKTYSLEFVKLLVCICTELETILKLICNTIDGSTPGNIGQYKQLILSKYPKIWSSRVYVDSQNRIEFRPLIEWNKKGGKLTWWDSFVNIKHQRGANLKSATLYTTLEALGALLITECYLYKISYPPPMNLRYGTSLLRIDGLADITGYHPKGELPDFE